MMRVLFQKYLKLYTDRAGKDVDEFRSRPRNRRLEYVRFVVHRMRSAAVPLGLKNLVVLLKKVEMKFKDDILIYVETEIDDY